MHDWCKKTPSEAGGESSFVIVYAGRRLLSPFVKVLRTKHRISWQIVGANMLARFFVGLVVGGGICILLVPLVFWPSRRNPHSFFEQFSDKGWVGWLFAFALLLPAVIGALTTKLHFPGIAAKARVSHYDEDDRVKIGCLGILLPLALAAYGVHRILNPRKINRFTGKLMEQNEIVSLGICALGLALLVHGWGFIPYTRIPGLRWVVMLLGVLVFVFGLNWANRAQ